MFWTLSGLELEHGKWTPVDTAGKKNSLDLAHAHSTMPVLDCSAVAIAIEAFEILVRL